MIAEIRNVLKVTNFKKVGDNERGSFTLEASLVMPVLFLATLTLLFFLLIIYQRAFMYYQASKVVTQAAFNWDNSHREARTGKLTQIKDDQGHWMTDGPYWMYGGQGFPMFGTSWLIGGDGSQSFEIMASGNSMPEKKIRKVAAAYGMKEVGSVKYTSSLFKREIEISMNRERAVPNFARIMFGVDNSNSVTARTTVSEPVEFLRSVEFCTQFLPYFADKAL